MAVQQSSFNEIKFYVESTWVLKLSDEFVVLLKCGAVDLFSRSCLLDGVGLLQPVLPFHVRRKEVHPPLQELHFHTPPTGTARLATLLPLVTLWLSLEVIVYSINARFKALASFNISLYLLGTLLPGYPLAFCGIDTLLDGFFYVPVLLKSWILSLVVLHVATLLLWY